MDVDDLIAQITEKTGITAEKAKEVTDVVTAWLKEKLPDDLVEMVGSALDGAGDMAASAVEKSKGAAGTAAETASGAAGAATETAGGLWDKAKDAVSGFMPGDDE